jgi:hypothetical protein
VGDFSQAFLCSEDAFSRLMCSCLPDVPDNSAKFDEFIRSFPILFSDKSGTVKGMVYHLALTDSTSVSSRPYQGFHLRLYTLKETDQDLLGLSC